MAAMITQCKRLKQSESLSTTAESLLRYMRLKQKAFIYLIRRVEVK